MPTPAEQPRFSEPVVDQRGYVTRAWADYFLRMASAENDATLRQLYEALAARVAALEEGQGASFNLFGQQSVVVQGTPADGIVFLTLQGDVSSPGVTEYYGTGPTGTKGWFPVSGTITVNGAELTKTVGTDGVVTLGLADVPDSGTGTLLATTFDAKGRKTGSKPATITGTAQQIDVANGNAAAGLPTLSLAPEVLAALAEAVTALQPSDVTGPNSVKVTPNGSGGIILRLDNDEATPAALTAYSTDSTGARGWHRPALFESTGVINGGALTINAGNNARFDMAQAVIGYTDWSVTPTQPTRVLLTVGPFTAQVVTNIASANATYVGIQMPGGTIVQQTSPFSNAQRRTIAQIGVLVHSNNINLNAINDQAATIRSGVNQIGDLMAAIGPLNLTGNIYSANGANLNINKSAGSIFKMGSNFQASSLDPHVVSIGAQTALTFRYRLSNGTESADTTNINPNQYESAPGVLTNIPILGNQWHVQRINIFQSGLTRIQYGQQLYASLAAAVQGITTDAFNTEQNIAENGILRCYLIINRGLLGLLGSATFVNVSKFGATQAGGGIVPVHNDLSGLQGGASGEYYHLTAAQVAALSTYAIDANVVHKTGTETIGGNKTFSDLVLINNALTVDRAGIGTMSLTAPGGAAPGFIIRRTASGSLYRSEIRGQDGRLQLGTNPTAGADTAPSKFFEIWDDSIRSTVDNSISAGTAAFRFTQVFAVNGAINTSDARLKTEPRQLSEAERKAGSELARLPAIWEWLTGDRLHAGPTVQAAMAVMAAHELDPFAYSFICYDEWEAEEATYGEEGNELTPAREAGDRYSFRKEELLCFMVSALAAENDLHAAKVQALDARLAALEAKS
jgi:hypothetical protein